MPPTKINTEICNGCNICVVKCVVGNIELINKKAVPGDACICCGICVDICPVEAVDWSSSLTAIE
ncbi:MAG: ferredoxin [Nitrososphaeria archaeon]|nr:ferredoxin [Nitrososphaeria archaeon]NIQ32807.1 ferredoxin [Nitrososphaeria archaeon]